MRGGNTGAGASKHFASVPPWDARTQAPFAGLVQKYSVQTGNTFGVWSAIKHCCIAVMREPCQTVASVYRHTLRWLAARLPYPLCKKNRRFLIELEARLALRKQLRADRVETSRKRNITRQKNWAARASVHRLAFSRALGRE